MGAQMHQKWEVMSHRNSERFPTFKSLLAMSGVGVLANGVNGKRRSTNDRKRQAAILLSCYGDDASGHGVYTRSGLCSRPIIPSVDKYVNDYKNVIIKAGAVK